MWMILATAVICLAILCVILLPPSKGEIPPFLNDDGTVIDGSIAEKVFLNTNGSTLGMILEGKDVSKPVLLFLGGGPGIPEYFLQQEYPTNLADEFVVCYFEYRGTSLSYNSKLEKSTLSTSQYIADVIEVTRYLCSRFGQEKVYLMAHSFGTYIALNTITQHPEFYEAYIAISQMCNQQASEYQAYDYMLDYYKKVGDKKKIKALEQSDIKESEEAFLQYRTSLLRDNSMHELGIGTTRDMHSVFQNILIPSLKCKAYTPMERLDIYRGKIFAQNSEVALDAWNFDAFTQIPEIQIPVYFLAGVYDYTCCYSLQKEYYEQLLAPSKGFYTFHESAHSPLFEEPEKGLHIMIEDVKQRKTDLSD